MDAENWMTSGLTGRGYAEVMDAMVSAKANPGMPKVSRFRSQETLKCSFEIVAWMHCALHACIRGELEYDRLF